MKVIKNINNNVSLCIDAKGRELVAFGKGIGFSKPPYELPLSKIDRTFYGLNPIYLKMFEELPPEVLEISIAIVEYARSKIQKSMDPNLVITLADHIAFALKRQEENLQLKLSLAYDIPYLYETEMEIGQKSLRLIKHKLGVALPEVEAAYIALHIINSEAMVKNQSDEMDDEAIIEAISDIIETHFQIEIDRKSFNYSRFATHMHYMIKRGRRHELISSTNNQKLYETLRDESPQTFACLGKIAEYLAGTLDWSLSTDECVYLMIHINRFTFREDCNQ